MKKLTVYILFSLFIFAQGIAQSFMVEGCVYDETKAPLPGVNVIVYKTTTGTVTDVNGYYKIICKTPNDSLIFNFIGFNQETIGVKAQHKIDVNLTPSMVSLNEVIVTGYASRKSCSMTSSMQTVKSASISKVAQGRVAGVKIRGLGSRRYNNSAAIAAPSPVIENEESYASVNENGFQSVTAKPLSTFSIDVDKASYSNVRRYLNSGQKPPADAVRIEEMINYFDYEYKQPNGEHPFEINTEVAQCPWEKNHKLVMIGVQGQKIDTRELPPSNLVFLIDVSGSMQSENKLPLLQKSFNLLADNLRENDRVAIVVYAGAAGCVLPSTGGDNITKIKEAINSLEAGGSTAGGEGIKLAYSIARKNFIKGGNNRVILATDGDFNVGASSDKDMETLITDERKSGIFLTCLGFGMGNLKDSKLETLADKGNGNYAYIDNMQEANKTLVSEFGGTLFTIAKDVKIQIEFNPQFVQAYRLVGYENRLLNDEDFKDDTKDAGELGSGHTVTALYEVIPVGAKSKFAKDIDPLKYQKEKTEPVKNYTDEIATVKMRYKKPDGDKSIEMEKIIANTNTEISESTENLRFASSVAMFGMLLRESEFKGESTLSSVVHLAASAKTYDKEGYKAEFVRLVKSSLSLASNN